MTDVDIDDPTVEAKVYCVRDIDGREPDLGIQSFHPADKDVVGELRVRGIGFEFADAGDTIEERVDLAEHVGQTVATVAVEFDDATRRTHIDFHVDGVADVEPTSKSLGDRLREVLLP